MLESVRFVYAAMRPWDVTQIRESHGQSVRVDKYDLRMDPGNPGNPGSIFDLSWSPQSGQLARKWAS